MLMRQAYTSWKQTVDGLKAVNFLVSCRYREAKVTRCKNPDARDAFGCVFMSRLTSFICIILYSR